MQLALDTIQPENAGHDEVSFAVKLPGGAIEGTVVNAAGAPQRAAVTVVPPLEEQSLGLAESITDASTGRFRIAGLSAGEYTVSARGLPTDGPRADALVSDIVPVIVGTGKASVSLVLNDALTLSGRVVTPSGEGVAGASVDVIPAQSPFMPIRVLRTDAEGRFSARVPRDTRQVVITVSSVGVGRLMLARAIPDDRTINLTFDPRVGQLVFGANEAQPDSTVMVYRDGGFVSLSELQAWSARNGGTPAAEPDSLHVPFMVPGHYRACRLLGPNEFASFLAGTLPRNRCDEGELNPGAELRFDLARKAPTPGGS